MANLKRKIPLQFYVNEEEKKIIRKNDYIKDWKYECLSEEDGN